VSTLILVRHGESVWNAANRFTGWVDVPLSEEGRKEARRAGERLAAEGVSIDCAFTSGLDRAIETGQIVLDTLGQGELPQTRAWQLNERFYGALTGRDKAEVKAEVGEETFNAYRRGFATGPPAGESLKENSERTLPYFYAEIVPATRTHDVVLVSAHGNSLRAIVKDLDGLDDEAVTRLELGTGVPVLYQMSDGQPVGKRILDG